MWRIVSDTLPRQLCRGEREKEGGRGRERGRKEKESKEVKKGGRGVKKHKEKQVKVNDVNRLFYL